MTHQWKTDTLAQRLRALADELESAQRYGLTLPTMVIADDLGTGRTSFIFKGDPFGDWVDYTEATVTEYSHGGRRWQRAEADMNGLLVEFSSATPVPTEVAA